MSYNKTVWEDLPSTNTPLNATNLNHIEDGIVTLESDLQTLESDLQTLGTNITPVVLYHNASGNAGNVTLSETINNFSYIEIYYAKGNGDASSVKLSVYILRNVGSVVTLYSVNNYSSTDIQELYKNIRISGTTITSNYGLRRNSNTSGNGLLVAENDIKIYTVLGYR